jgi:hypothetical protein
LKVKHALVRIPEQMEWSHADVGSAQTAFEQAPEVLHAVDVNLAVDVLSGMIDGLMSVDGVETTISLVQVGVERRTIFYVLLDVGLESRALLVGKYLGTDFAATLESASDNGLVFAASPGDPPGFDGFVHVPRLAADVGLIDLDLAGKPALSAVPAQARYVAVPKGFLKCGIST